MRIPSKGKLAAIVLLVCAASAAPGQEDSSSKTYWSRGVFKHPIEGYTAAHRFELWEVTFDKGHLTGRLSLYQVTDDKAPTIKVEGSKTKAGLFFPKATLQVEDPASKAWRTITENCNGSDPASVSISRGQMNPELYVCLDAYKPFLTTHKRGRVLLDTGDAAIFDLSDLTPNGP